MQVEYVSNLNWVCLRPTQLTWTKIITPTISHEPSHGGYGVRGLAMLARVKRFSPKSQEFAKRQKRTLVVRERRVFYGFLSPSMIIQWIQRLPYLDLFTIYLRVVCLLKVSKHETSQEYGNRIFKYLWDRLVSFLLWS